MQKSQMETSRIRHHVSEWSRLAWLAVATVLVVGLYLLFSRATYTNGFPLDDAWIHQTYARNLGQNGEWAFISGQPSSGSTSPLWTVLLAIGYSLNLPYLGWTYLLGAISLLTVAWTGENLSRGYFPADTIKIPLAGLFLAGEWHLAWASVSGMETLLSAAFVLVALHQVTHAQGSRWGLVGLLIGLGVWIRPDLITLLGPAGFVLGLSKGELKKHLVNLGWLAGGLGLIFTPYLLFNLTVQGSLWPNTFYAKQAEYASLQNLLILARFWNQLRLPLIGAGIFLVPGFGWAVWQAWRYKHWGVLAGAIWFAGYAFIYALRLPVTYQYGRYLIPAMPVFFIIGLIGSYQMVGRLRLSRVGWLWARVGILSAAAVWLAFGWIGAGRYSQDVAIVEQEMVAPARWIAAHTSEDVLIAAHDIGAAGYFSQRQLLDLAGLISPQVIPFMRDEARLARYLDQEAVDYLVVLDGWYEHLPDGKTVVFRSEGKYALSSGGSNMLIYQWK